MPIKIITIKNDVTARMEKMDNAEKQNLLDLMKKINSSLLETILKVNLEIIIHKDSGWRGREMLSHIGAWDREGAKALYGYLNGKEYLMLEYDEDDFNHQAAKEQQNMTTSEVIDDWKRAQKELLEAVEKIPADRLPGDLLYPWGDEHGTIYGLVKDLCDHAVEHQEELDDFMQEIG